MRYIKFFVFSLIGIFIFVFSRYFSVDAHAIEINSYDISYIYEENESKFIYFDISDTNICIAYDNDKIYEFNINGDFIRIIYYSSPGNIYSYYKENNLVIYDLRKNLNIVIGENGNCIETFESLQISDGYYVGDDFCNDIFLEKNGFVYQYINSNWFLRVFKNQKSTFLVLNNDFEIIKIEENFKFIEELIPIFIVSLVVLSLLSFLYFKKRQKV